MQKVSKIVLEYNTWVLLSMFHCRHVCNTWCMGYGTGVSSGTSSAVFSNAPFFSSRSFPATYQSRETEVQRSLTIAQAEVELTFSHSRPHLPFNTFCTRAEWSQVWRPGFYSPVIYWTKMTSGGNLTSHCITGEQSLQTKGRSSV